MPYKDPAIKRTYTAKWQEAHREAARVYSAKYRVEHPEQIRAYNATYYAAHRGELQIRAATLRRLYPEKQRSANARWNILHPEERRFFVRNREHQKRANGGYFSRAAWEHLKALFGHRCAYCGRRMERLTQDHIVPISKGGWHFSGNIVPACQSCNSRKGANTCLAA